MKFKNKRYIEFASVIIIVCTAVAKMMGLLREVKVASALGVSVSSDAYNIAYLLAITLFGLFSSAYSNSLMPVAAELYYEDKYKLQSVINKMITISIILMLLVIICTYLFPNVFVKLIASGINVETMNLASKLIKISIWSLIALVINSAIMIVMRIYNKNIYPTVTDLIFPIPIIVALFLDIKSPKILISMIVVGYFLRLALLLYGLKKINFKVVLNFKFIDKHVKSILILMPPMLLSSGLLQINTLVDNQVASKFVVGSVTSLSLAAKVNSLAYTMFSTSLMQMVYASMTKVYACGKFIEFKEIIKKQMRLILLFIIPSFIILYVFNVEIIQMLFMRGSFTYDNAIISGSILKGYAIGLIVFVIRDILIYVYYSAKDSKFPSIVTGCSVGINIILNIILSKYWGIKGIAYATSITGFFSCIILILFMRKRVMKIKLLNISDIISFIISGTISIAFMKILKEYLSIYSVWINIVAFIICFIFFWSLYFILSKLIIIYCKFIKKENTIEISK